MHLPNIRIWSFLVGGGVCSWQSTFKKSHKCPQILVCSRYWHWHHLQKDQSNIPRTCVGAMSQKKCLGAPHGVNNSQDWQLRGEKPWGFFGVSNFSNALMRKTAGKVVILGHAQKVSEQDLKENIHALHSNVSNLEAISWVIPIFMTLNQEGVPEQVALSMINGCMRFKASCHFNEWILKIHAPNMFRKLRKFIYIAWRSKSFWGTLVDVKRNFGTLIAKPALNALQPLSFRNISQRIKIQQGK